jgi:hypothetical protein
VTEDSLPEYMREDFVDEPLPDFDEEAGVFHDAPVHHGR